MDTVFEAINVTVKSINDPPVIASEAPDTATTNRLYTYKVVTEDAESDPISYHLLTSPDGMEIDANIGVITWTPQMGVLTSGAINVSAFDGYITTIQTFSLDVRQVDCLNVAEGEPGYGTEADVCGVCAGDGNYTDCIGTNNCLPDAICSALQNEIEEFYQLARLNPEIIGLRNGVQTALAITNAAIEDRISKGCHFISD